MTSVHDTGPENPPETILGPYSGTLDPRIQLAHSIVSHRPWCRDCEPHAADVKAALTGATIDEITGGA